MVIDRDVNEFPALALMVRAFAEMDRLGKPSQLAAALLQERGLAPGEGIQAASWWRMGVAAFMDVFVGLARIGGTRTVVRTADLLASGLTAPTRTKVSAGLTVTLAALLLLWAVWMVSGGALDPAGDAAVFRFAGPVSSQQGQVEASAIDLYTAATAPAEQRVWPPIAENLDAAAIEASFAQRFVPDSAAGSGSGGYSMDGATNIKAGVWTVAVTEHQADGTDRPVLLTYSLRVDWGTDGQPRVTWLLTGYEPVR